MDIGLPELLVIFVIILLLFGAKKVPELARSLGQGIREFKKSMQEAEHTGTIEKSDESTKQLKT